MNNMPEISSPTSESTLVGQQPVTGRQPRPPPLNYSLRDRKRSIIFNWSIIVLDSCIIAEVLFYPLWYGTSLSENTVTAIVGSLVGVVSLLQFLWRTWLLWKWPDRRPLGVSSVWAFDCFHWAYLVCIVVIVAEIVAATVPSDPILPLLSMPGVSVMFIAGGMDMAGTIGYLTRSKMWFRVSSMPKGELYRPGVYSIIEDIVAVDGGGGLVFRQALDDRYRASPEFRRMLMLLSLFWSGSGLLVAGAITAVIWTVPRTVAYGIGWGAPFVWAAIWAAISFALVPRLLRREYRAWEKATLTEKPKEIV